MISYNLPSWPCCAACLLYTSNLVFKICPLVLSCPSLHFFIFLSACDEQLLPNSYWPGIQSLQLEFRPFIDDLQSLRGQLKIYREVKELFSSFCVSWFDVGPLTTNPTVVSRSFRFTVAIRRKWSLPKSARRSTLLMAKLILVGQVDIGTEINQTLISCRLLHHIHAGPWYPLWLPPPTSFSL